MPRRSPRWWPPPPCFCGGTGPVPSLLWPPEVRTQHHSPTSDSADQAHELCPLSVPYCLYASPCGTAFWEIQLPGGWTKTARASLLGMRPAARLAPPGEGRRHVPLGRLGPGPGRPGAGTVGQPLSLPLPSFLPLEGQSAGFPRSCVCIRTKVPPHPDSGSPVVS